jgi:hypothetical protein
MALTENIYTGDGTTVLFSFTFPYINQSHVKVSLNGTPTTEYTLANATTVQMTTAPGAGVSVRVYRDTDSTALEAEFFPGSAIRSQDLNNNFTQVLYKAQETETFAASTDASDIAATATEAVNTANSALSVANTANSTANAAESTANGISAVANAALPRAGGVMSGELKIGTTASLTFEGSTDDANKTTLAVVNPTLPRTITFPNENGTVVTTGSSGVVTGAMVSDSAISTAKVADGAITSGKIADDTIVNADVNASAAIAGTKISPDFGSQNVVTTGTVTAGSFPGPVIDGTILEDVFTITDGAAFEVDPGNGSVQLITLGASRTPKATNFAAGESITLMVSDGTAYTLTWTDATWGSGGVVWVGGSAPTLATSGYTVIQFWKVSTQVYGALVGDVA